MNRPTSKKKIAAFLSLAVLMTLAILLYVNSKTAQRSTFLMEGKEKLTITGEVAAVSNNSSSMHCVKDMLIEAQDENIRVKNINGSVAWSQKLQGKVSKMADTGENIIIVDSQNNINYYSLQGKLLWTYKASQEIIDVFTEENGCILAEYKGLTGSHAEVFTKEGNKIGSISVENSHVLSFSAGKDSFSISVLDTSAEGIKTKIITYDFKGDILWAQNFDNKIISRIKYNKNNKLLALGESDICIYKNDGSLQSDTKIEGKISNAAMSDYAAVVALNNKGKNYAICYDADMRELSRTEIRPEPKGLFPMKNNYVLYYNDELMVLTVKGELTAKFTSNTDISSIYMTPENKMYIVSNRVLQQLEYAK